MNFEDAKNIRKIVNECDEIANKLDAIKSVETYKDPHLKLISFGEGKRSVNGIHSVDISYTPELQKAIKDFYMKKLAELNKQLQQY